MRLRAEGRESRESRNPKHGPGQAGSGKAEMAETAAARFAPPAVSATCLFLVGIRFRLSAAALPRAGPGGLVRFLGLLRLLRLLRLAGPRLGGHFTQRLDRGGLRRRADGRDRDPQRLA